MKGSQYRESDSSPVTLQKYVVVFLGSFNIVLIPRTFHPDANLKQTGWDVYLIRAAVSILLLFSLINLNNDHLISTHLHVHARLDIGFNSSGEETEHL